MNSERKERRERWEMEHQKRTNRCKNERRQREGRNEYEIEINPEGMKIEEERDEVEEWKRERVEPDM